MWSCRPARRCAWKSFGRHHLLGLVIPERRFTGRVLVQRWNPESQKHDRHALQTLAIETSCDDTSVAVLSIQRDASTGKLQTDVRFHERITAQSEEYKGIHPVVALQSHQSNLGPLLQKAVRALKLTSKDGHLHGNSGSAILPDIIARPDFITVTRGPGMRSNLSVGLDQAKGLAAAWDVPLVGVHHMQAHALTPRLCQTLKSKEDGEVLHRSSDPSHSRVLWEPAQLQPTYPFLGLLVSGGHTMLIKSTSLTDHTILAETDDIAIGDCLDKAARAILPEHLLKAPYGKALEEFAFPNGSEDYNYIAPTRRHEELQRRETRWGWSFRPPLSESKAGPKSTKRMVYSFGGLCTSAERFMTQQCSDGNALHGTTRQDEVTIDERRGMAQEVLRVAFEHLCSRLFLYLSTQSEPESQNFKSLVVSGGVASNRYLRHVMRAMLDARGCQHVGLEFPPAELCTDNALMIAWAGMEMFDAGFQSELGVQPLRKWTMDPEGHDGGILGADGWLRT
ncbi:hypothetical protein K431DRAFT_288803 [Polychaeton citri CBS 116435]|uniref:Gcp-like domain-containing protein n=1 Tax=Polychaeton citri CBS 116435 TaxID=1314669 RepID=A0A9P4Q0G7_9PEZI|nr:hypothetical protein K431DRAFT_288803 [Polychaeton citri CBS 116435]